MWLDHAREYSSRNTPDKRGHVMDFALTEDQRAIEDAARRFAQDRLAPYAAEWDEKSFFPVETMREAAALGFASIYVKSDVGGSEMSRLDAAIIMEELSAGCTSTAAFISIQIGRAHV